MDRSWQAFSHRMANRLRSGRPPATSTAVDKRARLVRPGLDAKTDKPVGACAGPPAPTPAVVSLGDYDVLVRPGATDTLVVCLAGFGEPDKVPAFEWRDTVQQAALDAHVVFFRDRAKSWFNSANGWADAVGWFQTFQAEHRIARTIAIGISMGGFGAAVLAQCIPIQRVIAISPQASIDPTLAFDHRFNGYWQALANAGGMTWPDLSRATAHETEYLCFYTIDDHYDVAHAALLASYQADWRLFACRGEHNVAGAIRRQGRLVEWLRGLLEPVAAFTHGDESADHDRYFGDCAAFAAGNDSRLRARADAYLDCDVAASAPMFLYPWLSNARFDRLLRSSRSYRRALQDHAYPIAPGLPILGENLRRYLTYGWGDDIEGDGLWSTGELHSLRADLLTSDGAESYQLDLGLHVFLPTRECRQKICVYVGGEEISSFAFSRERPVRRVISIQVPRHIVDIVFETPDAISPFSAGLNADARRLTFKVVYFSIEPRRRLRTRKAGVATEGTSSPHRRWAHLDVYPIPGLKALLGSRAR